MDELLDVVGPVLLAAIVTMAIISITTYLVFSQGQLSGTGLSTLGDYIAQTIGSLFPGV